MRVASEDIAVLHLGLAGDEGRAPQAAEQVQVDTEKGNRPHAISDNLNILDTAMGNGLLSGVKLQERNTLGTEVRRDPGVALTDPLRDPMSPLP
jgi:hypothetical protein